MSVTNSTYDVIETSIASARASVMIYDDVNKRWMPSGSSAGVSKVHIFQHNLNNTFRVVGRKLKDHEVVINCIIGKTLKYNQATTTFHQWRDFKQVYGLNFSSKDDADVFAKAMNYAVDTLTIAKPMIQVCSIPTSCSSPNIMMNGQQQILPLTNGIDDENMSYMSMTKDDVVALNERRLSQQSQILSSPGNKSSVATSTVHPQALSGHQRTSSAPPAPQPPPVSLSVPLVHYVPVTIPAQETVLSTPTPPCPPPLPSLSNSSKFGESLEIGSLTAQFKTTRLRRSSNQSIENSGTWTNNGGANHGTLSRAQGAGMASMMDEMAKTLARRRAAVEKKDLEEDNFPKSWNLSNPNGCENSKLIRKQSMTSPNGSVKKLNGDVTLLSGHLENLKLEILRELREELGQLKRDIIDALKEGLSFRK